MGVTWPGRNNPGYLCVFALEKKSDVSIIVMLEEREETDRVRLFEKMTALAKKFGVREVYAKMGDAWLTLERSFSHFCIERGVGDIRLYDASEWASFETALPIIRERAIRNTLRIPSGLLESQYLGMRPDSLERRDGISPEERFHCMNAFSLVICGYELFPARKKISGKVTKSGEGYR